MAIFENLQLWLDDVPRPGPEAMAVDEWLLGQAAAPVLRIYGWQGAWGSLGYFGSLAEARASFPGLSWVRRWTGGGIVDHRRDWTYTLAIPLDQPVARMKGAESYRLIHEALCLALREYGVDAHLSAGEQETGATACFENPVCHDLMDGQGRKLAGAGQRRTRVGLLHQGSVALPLAAQELAIGLARHLSQRVESVTLEPPAEWMAAQVKCRYDTPEWRARRC